MWFICTRPHQQQKGSKMGRKKKDAAVEIAEQTDVTEEVSELAPAEPETVSASDEPAVEAAPEQPPAEPETPPETTDEALAREKENDVELKKTRRAITVLLGDTSVLKSARAAAALSERKTEVENEFASVKQDYKKRLEELDGGIAERLKEVRDGTEQRIVDLEEHFDYTDGVVRVYHAGEKIEERTLTSEERQLGMKFIEAKDQQQAKIGDVVDQEQLAEALPDAPAETTEEPQEAQEVETQTELPLQEAEASAAL